MTRTTSTPCSGRWRKPRNRTEVTALIFDLDGTLVDTVYAHVFAWQRALAEVGMPIDGWRIHRRIGMSGGLFARAVAREVGRPLGAEDAEAVQRRHGELYRELLPERRPLPGAVELLAELRLRGVVHGIATSGRRPEIDASLEALRVEPSTTLPWPCLAPAAVAVASTAAEAARAARTRSDTLVFTLTRSSVRSGDIPEHWRSPASSTP